MDGNQYEVLSVGAEKLAQKFPLSASILLRAMIDFTLDAGRSSRYKHAARPLLECGTLARYTTDYGAMAPHDVYIAGLRKVHGRKHGFWTLFDEPR